MVSCIIRASTIELSQRAIRNKLVYFCLVEEREEGREGKWALREETALARAPRHFVE